MSQYIALLLHVLQHLPFASLIAVTGGYGIFLDRAFDFEINDFDDEVFIWCEYWEEFLLAMQRTNKKATSTTLSLCELQHFFSQGSTRSRTAGMQNDLDGIEQRLLVRVVV